MAISREFQGRFDALIDRAQRAATRVKEGLEQLQADGRPSPWGFGELNDYIEELEDMGDALHREGLHQPKTYQPRRRR